MGPWLTPALLLTGLTNARLWWQTRKKQRSRAGCLYQGITKGTVVCERKALASWLSNSSYAITDNKGILIHHLYLLNAYASDSPRPTLKGRHASQQQEGSCQIYIPTVPQMSYQQHLKIKITLVVSMFTMKESVVSYDFNYHLLSNVRY